MKVLVLSAHPDDEILGVCGTLCKHIENGDLVYICIVTKAFEPQWSKVYMDRILQEQNEVDKFLNIKKRFNLNLPTTKLNTIAHGELNKKISDIVDEINPQVLYTHFEHDLNEDHAIIFKASLVATRPPKKIKLLCYETLSSSEWKTKAFKPNYYVDIKDYIDKKIKTFQIYESEVKAYPYPRSLEGIRIQAKKRGSEVCIEYSEAFILIRDYWI